VLRAAAPVDERGTGRVVPIKFHNAATDEAWAAATLEQRQAVEVELAKELAEWERKKEAVLTPEDKRM
jgi:hypothetical protein